MNIKSWQFRTVVGASTIAVSAVVALGATGMTSAVFAAGANNGPSAPMLGTTNTQAVHPDSSGAKKETLLGTYIQSGVSTSAVSAGFTALDPANKLTCPSGQTCTITATISVQLGGNLTAANLYAAEWTLDNESAGQSPYLGETPSDGTYAGDTWTSDQPGVAAGKHTVETYVFSRDGATLGSWTVTYNLYD